MLWPMIHFSIAYRMFDGYPNKDFLLGSIAPDAVQFRESDKSSKAIAHLHNSRGNYPDWSGLIDFYKAKVNIYRDDTYKMFLLGYISHIIADDLWVKYKREISGSDKSILEKIWIEENQYDFNLKRTTPWRDLVESQVITATLYELSGIYNLNELDKWRRQLFIWLQEPQNGPLIDNQYLIA
ncbi:zinc dependent phospholipase C family protein [Paenibacillus sp. V4I7]|uniref:zinc dependent phospholipase C family protein n=1 Tax=Paenibacillus sp. V4I7 TaxID=3042307 RepID=UPI002780DAAD|nr:zinc dependent phospholipase C family protein [Paenibacillus sp. V4I7]MDQ0899311.1 hypothetical protein [Paenibacillus sp. V4I7]